MKIKRFIRSITKWGVVHVVVKKKLTYLNEEALSNIQKTVKNTNNLEGILIEAGCALGGSSIVIAHTKDKAKDFFIYDVFGMIPQPSEKDGQDVLSRYATIKDGKSKGIDGDEYYGYKTDLLNEVKQNFVSCGIALDHSLHFVQGLYQETMHITTAVSFAHIDCDWYDSVMVCLERIIPHLVVGGEVIIDDYSAWSGCRTAVDEYFSHPENNGKFKLTVNRTGRMIIKREQS